MRAIAPEENAVILVVGNNDALNARLFKTSIRLSSCPIVVGEAQPCMKQWLAITDGKGIEFWPSGSPIPSSGNFLLLDGTEPRR